MRSDTAAKLPALLAWLVPLAIAAFALWTGLPSSISAAAYEANLVFGFIAVMVAFLLPVKNLSATATARLLILLAAALPVAHVWSDARCDGALLAGLFPQSDAGGYLSNAIALLGGRPAWDFATRPICASAFAPLLLLAGFNLKALILLLTLLNASAIAAVAEQVQRFIGGAAAGLFAFGSLCLYRITAGWLMTEQMGILLGMAAAGLLVAGCRTGSVIRLSQGLFLLSLALLCRAGAFFALPALAAGITLFFAPEKGWRGWLRAGCVAGMAMVLAVALDFALGQVVYEQGKRPPSNFWYVAYGVLNDTDWTAADKKFNHQVNLIKDAVFQQAKAEPWRIGSGAARAMAAGFKDHFFFSHLKASTATNRCLSAVSILSLLGLVHAGTRRFTILLALIFVGTLASLPFAPPWDGGIRIHAAIVPTLTLIPTIGIAALVTLLHDFSKHRSLRAVMEAARQRQPVNATPPYKPLGFVTQMPAAAWLLAALASPVPIICKALGTAHFWPRSVLARLEPSADGIIDPGFFVTVNAAGNSYVPAITRDRLAASLKRAPWDQVAYSSRLLECPAPSRLKCVFIPEDWKSYGLNKTVTVYRFALCIAPAQDAGLVTSALRLPKDEYWNSYLLLDSSLARSDSPPEWQAFAKSFR